MSKIEKNEKVTKVKKFNESLIIMFPNSLTGITVYVLETISTLLFERTESTEH